MNRLRIGGNEPLPLNLDRIDRDLDIMDRHAAELDSVEQQMTEAQRRREREFMDSHLHSVPRAQKHRGV